MIVAGEALESPGMICLGKGRAPWLRTKARVLLHVVGYSAEVRVSWQERTPDSIIKWTAVPRGRRGVLEELVYCRKRLEKTLGTGPG